MLRPIVIILLVFMHSFTMFTGGAWPLPKGIHPVEAYDWITKISFGCMLETFTFISGYLFAFQLIGKQQNKTLGGLVQNKLKRLILPSIVFSIIYSIFFYTKEFHPLTYFYDIINGLGNMWYLPMLFWCFIGGYILCKINISDLWKMLLLLALAFGKTQYWLPLQLSETCYYLFFFYLGFVVWKNRVRINKRATTLRILAMGGAFLLTLACVVLINSFLLSLDNLSMPMKLARMLFGIYGMLLYAFIGTCAMILLSFKLPYPRSEKLQNIVENVGAMSFGIYLVHQMILKFIYYSSPIPLLVGTYTLPWVGFILAFTSSVLVVYVVRKTKVGKFLIG